MTSGSAKGRIAAAHIALYIVSILYNNGRRMSPSKVLLPVGDLEIEKINEIKSIHQSSKLYRVA